MQSKIKYFYRRMVRLLAITALSGVASAPAWAQVNNPAYAEYLLVGRFGEICTMCEAVVLCAEGAEPLSDDSIPDGGSFTVYHLQTRTFWSQVSTIWEWFVVNFDPDALASGGHRRPVHVHDVRDGNWSDMQVIEAHLSLEPAIFTVGDHAIDRVERRWLAGPEQRAVGHCRRLPLWESLDVIAARGTTGPES